MNVDIAVIGAGPAGCTFAILAAQAGLRVALVEREAFPRHQIGESLLPANLPLFDRLGLASRLKAGPCVVKPGAVFTHEPTAFSRRVRFREAYEPKASHAYQVERSRFDALFLERVRELPIEVHQPARVIGAIGSGDGVEGVRIRDEKGESEIRARFTLDASGRAVCLGRLLGRIERDPILNQSSAYTYYDRYTPSPIAEPGDIEILQTDGPWFWLIPLADRLSLGAVWTKEQIRAGGNSLPEKLAAAIRDSATLRDRLAGARQIEPVRVVADYSYQVEPFCGRGWLCVGDAALFLDPVFSSGVALSTLSAEQAFDRCRPELLAGTVPSAATLDRYQRWLGQGVARFKRYVYGYYSPGFRKVFFSDPPLRALRRAVASNLAGNVFTPSLRTRFWASIFWHNVRRANRELGYRSPWPGLC